MKVKAKCKKCGRKYEMSKSKYNYHVRRGWKFFCSDECREAYGSKSFVNSNVY